MAERALAPVLIIEDERNIAALVAKYLDKAGFDAIVAHDGEVGLEYVKTRKPGFVILDLMLPRMDGWDVCREIRKTSDVPILMLTAREEEMDRVLGFSLGADDYVVKPFSPRELVERVKAILRRVRPGPSPATSPLRAGALVLDPGKHKATLDGQTVPLTPSEFKLLDKLMSSPGRVFSRDDLIAHLYMHDESVVDRVIDVHIGNLRQKIEKNPSRPSYVLTVRGVGYSFTETDPAETKPVETEPGGAGDAQ